MADINAQDLTAETLSTLDGTENVVAFDTATGKRIPLTVLGDYVIQKLVGSATIAGSSQTIKSAFDSLNSNLTPVANATVVTDLDDATVNNKVYYFNAGAAHNPGYNYGFVYAWNQGGNINQIAYPRGGGGNTSESIARRSRGSSTGTWGDWVISPTRAEMDAATAATTVTQLRNTDLNTLTEPMRVYYAGGSHGCTNVPANAASFGLIVLQISSGYRAQICISSGLNVYIRRYASDSWGSWFEFAKSAIS